MFTLLHFPPFALAVVVGAVVGAIVGTFYALYLFVTEFVAVVGQAKQLLKG